MSRYSDIDLENKKLPPIGGYWSGKLLPLEEALKPIEPLINELNRSIKMAKKYCTFPSQHDLTHDESAAVYLYTMEAGESSFYKVLNEALRSENRPALKPWFPFLKLFDVALNKLPIVKGNIWRGVRGDVSGVFTKDQVLTWWSISSCSPSLDVIQDFLGSEAGSTIFMIEAINGRNVSHYSFFKNEDEVILSLGTELRVKTKTPKQHGGLNIVHLVELTEDDVEQLPKAIAKIDLEPKVSATNAANIQQPAMALSSNPIAQTNKHKPTSGIEQASPTFDSAAAEPTSKKIPSSESEQTISTIIVTPTQQASTEEKSAALSNTVEVKTSEAPSPEMPSCRNHSLSSSLLSLLCMRRLFPKENGQSNVAVLLFIQELSIS